jgi:tRNA (guanine-N7-)-methyltransferase
VPVREVWLEIGFGGGEHLLWQGDAEPDVGLIGCEPFQDGVTKVLRGIEVGKLANIRLHADDARAVLRWLPKASLARAFILFPDPWPKKRHQKRRLVSAGLLRELARVMVAGAELRMATDIGDYARWMLQGGACRGQLCLGAREPERLAAATGRLASYPLRAESHQEGAGALYLSLRRR